MRSFNLFDKYGVENCEIVLLESVNCNSKEELLARERWFIENNKCVNKYIPFRTPEENKQLQQLYDKNRQCIKDNCKCGGLHTPKQKKQTSTVA